MPCVTPLITRVALRMCNDGCERSIDAHGLSLQQPESIMKTAQRTERALSEGCRGCAETACRRTSVR